MDVTKIDRFLNKGNFARFASMSFPQAVDEEHFTTGYQFYLWAFIVSILTDKSDVCLMTCRRMILGMVAACVPISRLIMCKNKCLHVVLSWTIWIPLMQSQLIHLQ
jgi:hypothetical protein